MKIKKLINKKAAKKFYKKCYFCPCDTYELLDVHRVQPGADEGKYYDFNSIIVCSNCHRKIHAGIIKTFKKYYSTSGKYVLHYIDENGIEHFD